LQNSSLASIYLEEFGMRKALLILAVFGLVGMLWAADPHVGTWKLNVGKSKITGPTPKSVIVKFADQENGIKIISDEMSAEGKATHVEFAGKFDGKDYTITGDPDVDKIVLKKIDANGWDEVLKKAGKEIARGQNVVSKDGKTMTRTLKFKNEQGQEVTIITIYDKQ
jgi:hypothetical protein